MCILTPNCSSFSGQWSLHPKKTHPIHTGTLLWMSNTKEWSKLGIPHRFRDEVWWSGRWTVLMKRKQLEFLQPCWHFLCLITFPTFMSHHLPQFKNRTSSPPSLWDVKWPGYLHHFPLLCYVPWRFPRNKPGTLGWIRVQASKPCKKTMSHTPLNRKTKHCFNKHLKGSAKKTHEPFMWQWIKKQLYI